MSPVCPAVLLNPSGLMFKMKPQVHSTHLPKLVFRSIRYPRLHQSGKQLVLTSDKAPKDLEGLQERLLSRFRWGLSADIQVPDYETRIEILEKKMKADGLEMPNSFATIHQCLW